jgi:hypothetical protein
MYVIGQIAMIAGKDILTRASMSAPATASGMKNRHEGGREQICAHR